MIRQGTGAMSAGKLMTGPWITTMKVRRIATGLLMLSFVPFCAFAESVAVLRDGDVGGWEEKVFSGKTAYERVSIEGRTVLRATSRGTASGPSF